MRGSLLEKEGRWRDFLRHYITFPQTAYKVSLLILDKVTAFKFWYNFYAKNLLQKKILFLSKGRDLSLKEINVIQVSIKWPDGSVLQRGPLCVTKSFLLCVCVCARILKKN